MTMTTILNLKIGEARNVPRLWLEGQKLSKAGVKVGARYSLKALAGERIELHEVDAAYQGPTFNVSKRERNGVVHPLFEIRTGKLREVFEQVESVRVAIRNGRIVVTAHHMVGKIRERVARVLAKLRKGAELAVCSLFHGGGVLDRALHDGMMQKGVPSFTQVAVEIESNYLDASLRNNRDLWRDESVAICSDVRDVNWQHSPIACDVLTAGLPCTGMSKSGRAKNKLTCGEEHAKAGALFVDFLEAVRNVNPAIVVLECVPELQNSASMAVIRSVLDSLGYVLQEAVLDGAAFGALERRQRFVAVAVTKGLTVTFDFESLAQVKIKEACIRDVLEPIGEDSPRWKTYSYLANKAVRDKAAGKGFARQLLTGDEQACGTIGRLYSKARSTEPFLIHPRFPELSRLFTPIEHARLKGIPEGVIEGESETVAHEILGQSVVFPQFHSVGIAIGALLKEAIAEDTTPAMAIAA
ncbi:DNA cytosine methyltransferase [Pseudomonas sp. Marseille-Q5115]|uniref:DNA cytosine methyltransferase n=1 Tax=Pseudomonas sp. Marseille-Q5115 TaxID=2866593 RepID=UPI001CE3F782|nr:DNA cytosine methyltransferase [Pseudomonas sp. Marseille-Q5115]